MKKITFLSTILWFCCIGLNAQNLQGEKTVTHFYIVNIDNDLRDAITSNNSDVNYLKTFSNNFVASIIDTFYTIASEKIKSDLGLELLPLNELQHKIKYNREYPNCPDVYNIKKVLKGVAGYKYYMDYYVNVFSDLNTDSPVIPSLTRIRPLFAISFTLFNDQGKPVEKVTYSYKSRKPLAEVNKQTNGSINEQLKTRLCDYYTEALNAFSEVCKKKQLAQL